MFQNRFPPLTLVALAVFSSLALAENSADRVQVGRDLVVEPAEKVGDAVCVACSIYVRGQVAGDAVAVAGRIVLEQGAQVAGDVTAVLGDVRLQSGTQVAGDVVVVAGMVRRDSQSQIAGQVTSLGGAGWMVLVLLFPLIVLGGIVALIIWLVQRSRRTVPAAAHPGGSSGLPS
ncbi:MAG TPA: hypothetical protein VEI52_13605 [Terriglobales bacterium]|nr:hypothetical protein [Terriglobales bacterium]